MMVSIGTNYLPPRYRLKDVIGKGGMGTVYVARDRLLGQDVALKHIFNLQAAASMDQEQMVGFRTALTHEFRTLATLRHPNVVSVLDYGFDSDGMPFFTMEWLSKGLTLSQATVDLGESERLDLFAQLLRALFYVHRRGIVHRDLKPNNILVVPGDHGLQVKVLDFGLSIPVGKGDSTTSGTLPYLAPEVFSAQAATTAADLYAVGVIMYQIFTGEYPFAFDSLSELLQKVMYEDPPFPVREISSPLEQVIRGLMRKDPQQRYPDARATLLALNESVGTHYPVETIATRDSFIQAAKFVGREAELNRLKEEMQQASIGQGRTWLIAGESGVGKSRLLDELRVEALISGVEVMLGSAHEEQVSPYQVWLSIIRGLLLSAELPDDETSIFNVFDLDLPNLLERQIAAPPDIEASAMQARLVEMVTYLLLNHPRPLLIILEDMHWAVEDSIVLLDHLAQRILDKPIMIVATYRNDHAPRLAERIPLARMMRLQRLDSQAVTDMLIAMVGDVAGKHNLVSTLQAETEGNAFFLVEIMRTLAEEAGELEAVTQADHQTMPERVRVVLERRFRALSIETRILLELAAIAGREINLRLLKVLVPNLDVELHLQEAGEFHVTEWRDGRWRFEHDKLRQQIISRLDPITRKALHSDIASGLEKIYTDDSMGRLYLPVIALNWEAADEPYRALPYLVTIAQDSFRLAAYDDALGFIERAVACVSQQRRVPLDLARQVMDALYMQFYAYRQREQRDLLHGTFEKALDLAERTTAPDLFLRAYQLGADAGALTYNPQFAQACAQRMLDYTAPDTGEALLAMYRLSQGYRMERRFAEAIEVAEKALSMVDRVKPWRGWNFPTTLYSYFMLPSFFESANGAGWSFATSLGYCCMMQGDDASAMRYFKQALAEMSVSVKSARYMISIHNVALYSQGHGEIEEALRLARQLREMAPLYFPALVHTADYLINIAEARLNQHEEIAAAELLKLAQTNFSEQEIEDAIICARDALVLFQQRGDGAGEAEAFDLLQKLNDPQLKMPS